MSDVVVVLKRPGEKSDDDWEWHQAVIVLAQLPEDPDAAMRVLGHAMRIVSARKAETTRA